MATQHGGRRPLFTVQLAQQSIMRIVETCRMRALTRGLILPPVSASWHDRSELPAMLLTSQNILSVNLPKVREMSIDELRSSCLDQMAMYAIKAKYTYEMINWNRSGNLQSQKPRPPVWGSPMWNYFRTLFETPLTIR